MSFPTISTGQLDARLAIIPDIEGVSIINGAAYPPPGGLPAPLPDDMLITGTGSLLPNPLQSSGVKAYQYVAPMLGFPPSGAVIDLDPVNPDRQTLYSSTDHVSIGGPGLTALQAFDNDVLIRAGDPTKPLSAWNDKSVTMIASANESAYINMSCSGNTNSNILMTAQGAANENLVKIVVDSTGEPTAPATFQIDCTNDNGIANVYILTHDESAQFKGNFQVSTGAFGIVGYEGDSLVFAADNLAVTAQNGNLSLVSQAADVNIGDNFGNDVNIKANNNINIGSPVVGNDVNVRSANDVNISAASQVTIGALNGGDTRVYAPSGYNVRIGNNVGGVRIAENAILADGVSATTQAPGTNDGRVATTSFLYQAFNNPQVSLAVSMSDTTGNLFTMNNASYITWQTVGKTCLFNGYWQWDNKGAAIAGEQFRLIFPGAVGAAMAARRAGLCIGLIGTGYPLTNNAMFAVSVASASYFNCRFFSSSNGTETNALVSHLGAAGSISVSGVLFLL